MKLESKDGTSFELRVERYQFPDEDLEPNDYNPADDFDPARWLIITISVSNRAGAWQATGPNMTTSEMESLATWLDSVRIGQAGSPGICFIERDMEFAVNEDCTVLQIYLCGVFRPSWARGMVVLEFPVRELDLTAAASSLREQLGTFPGMPLPNSSEDVGRHTKRPHGTCKLDGDAVSPINRPETSIPNTTVNIIRLVKRLRGNFALEENVIPYVNLMFSALSDEQLPLFAIPSLKHLNISDTGISDRGLAALGPMDALEILYVGRTSIDGSGLAGLSGRSLQTLYLRSCKNFGDAGLRHISRFTSLETLWLDGTGITDAGLAALAPLQRLKFLKLDSTNISDAGIASLAAIKSLRSLGTMDTKVTEEALEMLRKEIPHLARNLIM